MTRKDFQLIADVISSLDLSDTDRLVVAGRFAARLASTNTRFDAGRFLAACRPELDDVSKGFDSRKAGR
jgi:hypothetical protein